MLLTLALAVALVQVPPPSPSPLPTTSASPLPSPATLSASPAAVNLNPAQQATVTIAGATGALQATLDAKLVTTVVDQTARTVTLTATQATGSDTLHVTDASGASLDIPVRVAFNAGTIPAVATLSVTGSSVDPAWLALQVQYLVTRLARPAPGAQTVVAPVQPQATPLVPSQQTQFTVPVQIDGNGTYFDQSGSTNVTVQNVPLDAFAPSLLLYDDDPERVMQDGVLFRGTVGAAPARLYYYHDDGGDPRRVVVALRSQSQDPTSVQVIDASAGPNLDVMTVGHAVTRNFLLQKPSNEGTILDLGQDEPYVLHDLPMTRQQGVAGNLDIRVLSGGPVVVTVLAVSPGVDPGALLDGPILPDDSHHRTGVFSLVGFGSGVLTYTAGGPDVKLVYADRDASPPNVDASAAGHDYGDYGVLRIVAITLVNPTAAPVNAYLYERPIGGIVRSSFLVDGSLIELGCARESIPYQIAAYALEPGKTYRVVVQTMTDGGSNYPLEIGMTSTAPVSATPPISAPDGCFPKLGL